MGIAGSADIFQVKMMKLMATLEVMRANIYDLLCITKDPGRPSRKIRVGSFQMARCELGSKYLQIKLLSKRNRISWVYLLARWNETTTQEGTVDTFTDTAQNVKDLQKFLGMVQYY